MPTYDYVCPSCGHVVEVVHGVHGHGPTACARCGGPVRKAFTAPAVHFKGTGWAKKERGSRGAGSKTAAGKTDAGKSEGSSGTSGSDDPGSTGGASGTNATAPDTAGPGAD